MLSRRRSISHQSIGDWNCQKTGGQKKGTQPLVQGIAPFFTMSDVIHPLANDD